MKSKNKLIMLGLLMAVFLGFSSIDAYSAAITWDGGAGSSNWNDALNWSGDVVPTDADDVTINTAVTVFVNTAADVNSLTINHASAVLRPDASSARTMRIRDNLVLTNGSILYTNAGGTGRLSWSFDGSGATNQIQNVLADATKMQFYDLTFTGAITTPGTDGEGDMEIYGDLTVNGSFEPSTGADDSDIYFKGSGMTITNNGSLVMNQVYFTNNSSYTTNTDFSAYDVLNVASGSSLIVNNPAIVTLETNATMALTNNGTLTFNTGASVNIDGSTTLVGDLADFDADLTVAAGVTLKVTGGNQIEGDGSIATGSASVINVGDADGVAGAIELDTYSWNAATNFVIESGATGFSGASITTIGALTFGTDTGSALAITIDDTFSMSGALTVATNTGAVTTVTATSGTITMTGTVALTTNGETIDFYGLLIDGGTVTVGAEEGIVVNNYIGVATGHVLDFDGTGAVAAYDALTIDGTATILIDDIATGLLVDDYAEIELTGNVTFADGLTLAAQGTDGGINIGASAVVDLAGFVITTAGVAGNVTTASGATLKTAHADGIAGNFASTAANVFNAGTNYEYNTNATSFGFFDFDGAGTDITGAGDITINGGAIDETGAGTDVDVTLTGDLTVTTGSLILPDQATGIIIMNTAGGDLNIVNSTGSEDNLIFNILQLAGTNDVIVSGDFSVQGTNGSDLDFNAAATLDCTTNDATVYFTGAGTDIDNQNAGTYNFHHIVVEAATTINANVTSGFNIAGDLTVSAGSLTGDALSLVTFNGTVEQTIVNAGTLSFDLLTISNSVGVVTDDDMTWSNNDGTVTISGIFTASDPSNITFGGTGNFDVTGGEATFFDLTSGAGETTTTVGAGTVYLVNNLTGNAFTLAAATTLEITGNTADVDAITNDGKLEAVIDVTTWTMNGTVDIPETAELQVDVQTDGTGSYDVDGRLEFTATAAVLGAASTVDLTAGDGGTLHLSGTNTADLSTAVDAAGTLTTDETSSVIIDGQQTTFFDNTIVLLNLTLNSTGPITLESSDDITIHGTLTQDGTDMVTGDPASQITLAGANASITGTGILEVGILSIAATATNSTSDASIVLTSAGAGAFTLADGGVFESTGTINFDGGTAASIVNNGSFDDVVFHDVTITQTTIVSNDISISGSLNIVAGQDLTAIVGDANIYFSGSGETITIGGSNDLILHDVTFTGSYGLAGDFIIDVDGDLEVTNTGSFDMNSVGTLDFQGTGSSTITNDGNLTINDITITGGTALETSDNFTVEGDFTNTASSFEASGSSVITFDGTTALTGTATASETSFVSVTIEGTVTLTNDMTITGNLINNGTFAPNTATSASGDEVQFAGGTTKTIQNAGTLSFGDLTVNNVASNIVNTANSFNILSDISVGGGTGGKFEATAGTISFNGGGAQALINGTTVGTNLKFFNLTLTTASTVLTPTGSSDFYINGDVTIQNDAILQAQTNDVRIFFNGNDQQDINLTGTGTLGTSGRLFLHHGTVNNADGLRLVGTSNDIIESQLDVEGTLRLQSGDIDLNGENVLSIDVDNGGKLDETAGNTVVNNGPETSVGYVWADRASAAVSNVNVGGLGTIITTAVNTGLEVKRYHIPLTVGGETQASRYYSIVSSVTTGLDAKLVFKYDTSELGVLDEDDLILVYGDDPATDVWTIQESTLDTDLKRLTTPNDAIAGFTGQTEWWTIGTPDVLSATAITNGLASTPISAGTDDNAIFGVQYTSNGSVELSSVRYNLGRNLGVTNEVSSWKLVYSEDDDFSTTEDNETLIDVAPGGANTTGGESGDSFVTFDVSGQDGDYISVNEGTPINYFLVADIVSTVTASTSTITASTTNLLTSVNEGITEEYSLTGSAYAFRASIMVSPHEVSLTDSPLIAGQEDVALFGFKASVTSAAGLPGITGFTLDFDEDPSSVFENVRVYASASEHDFTNMGAGELIATTTSNVTSSGFTLVFTAKKQLATTPTYFFVVADVKNGVNNTFSDITPTLTYADLTSNDAGIRGTDINGNAASSHEGFVYSFVNSTVTVDVSNNTAASNLGTRVDRQPIFGFTLTPDNNQPVSFTAANLTLTLSSAAESTNLSNWGLYYDSNENGFPENSEKIANGTLTATSGSGNLTFSGFTQSLSSARKYLVGVKVGSGATAGTTIGVQLTSEDYLTVSSPAKINSAGPLPSSAVSHTIRSAGAASAFVLAHYNTSVTTGNTLAFTIRAVDANGYPTNVSAATAVTLAYVSGTGTIGGTNTGSIANGTNAVIISPTITAAAGSTDLVVNVTGGLTSSANSDAITVLEAEPSANDTYLTIGNINSTTIRITNITANTGSIDGRIFVIRQGSAPHAPTDGTAYTANLDLADALGVGVGQTGPGSYVVVEGNTTVGAASIDIEGLMPNTRYYIQSFAYNGTTPNFNYATGSAFTSETVRNPISFTTSSGDISASSTEASPANIQTDIDIQSTISAADEEDWYQFRIPSTRNNVIIRLSDLPANYEVELYDASAGISNKVLLRDSKVTSTGNEVIILNAAEAGPYVLKVYGANEDAFSTSNYTLRITTSNNEVFSQVE